MKKIFKVFIFILACILVLSISSVLISADTGPKPYVSIKIVGDAKGCYMTLLSDRAQYGPHSNDPAHQDIDDIDSKFASYSDSDGYYYLYTYSDISGNVYRWGYYPPMEFKILIYDSVNDKFITNNEKYERTSFETAFTIELVNDNGNMTFTVKHDHYHLFKVIMGIIIRLVICLAIEIGIAISFKIKKLQLLLVLIANVFTQLILNIVLGIFINTYGLNMMGLIPLYVFIELLVFILEGLIYCIFMKNVNPENKHSIKSLLLYTFSANVASLVLGFVLLTILGF